MGRITGASAPVGSFDSAGTSPVGKAGSEVEIIHIHSMICSLIIFVQIGSIRILTMFNLHYS